MLALYRCGRQADALDAYHEIVRRLDDELGVVPEEQLSRVHRAILTAAPEAAAPAADPEEVGTVPPPGGVGQEWKVLCQLPSDTGDFVGREDLQRQALSVLVPDRPSSAVPIVSLSGSPGVGKTALALRLAHQVRAEFPDGQWYVQMDGTSGNPRKTSHVLSELLRASGYDRADISDDLNACASAFRARLADRRVLLLFDDVHSTEQVRALLPGTPGCAVIVTRRADLSDLVALHGARPFALDVLSEEESATMLTRTLGAERVATERAAVAELIRLCAHLPLAMRIAAANLTSRPQHSIADYVGELRKGNRLSTLAVGAEPKAAIRAAFALSYRTLSPAARRLFRLLGLIPGADFTVPLAAELARVDLESARSLLETLATAHLVETQALGRYSFHDLLRLYAAERSRDEDEVQERDNALRRLCEWFLYSADAAMDVYQPGVVRMPVPRSEVSDRVPRPTDARDALAWLDRERTNLVAVVRSASDHGLDELSPLLADTLRGYFWGERLYADWLTVASAGLRSAARAADLAASSAMRLGLGLAHQGLNRLADAGEHIKAALEGFRKVGAEDFEAVALASAAMLELQQPTLRVDDAVPKLERGLRINQRLGLRHSEGRTRRHLGILRHAQGRLDAALENFTLACRIYTELELRPPLAELLARLGLVHLDLGDRAKALHYLERGLDLAEELTAPYDTAIAHQGLAMVLENRAAWHHILLSLDLAGKHGYHVVEVNSTNVLAGLQWQAGQPAEAMRTHRAAMTMARQLGHPQAESVALIGLAHLHLDTGDPELALTYAQRALRTARRPGFRLLEGRSFAVLASALHELGEQARAATAVREAVELFTECGYHLRLPEALRLQQRITVSAAG